jgi:hypothetical protein
MTRKNRRSRKTRRSNRKALRRKTRRTRKKSRRRTRRTRRTRKMKGGNKELNDKLKTTVTTGTLEEVEALLNAGADPNLMGDNGPIVFRPYIYGLKLVEQGGTRIVSQEIVKALLNAGADPKATDRNGITLLTYAAMYDHTDIVNTLIDKGVDQHDMDEALDSAVRRMSRNVLRLLLDAGANPNAINREGQTAFVSSIRHNDLEIIEALLNAGADINARDQDDKTALIIATEWGYLDIVEALLNAGADINARDQDDKTALIIAIEDHFGNRNEPAVELISNYMREFIFKHQKLAAMKSLHARLGDNAHPNVVTDDVFQYEILERVKNKLDAKSNEEILNIYNRLQQEL